MQACCGEAPLMEEDSENWGEPEDRGSVKVPKESTGCRPEWAGILSSPRASAAHHRKGSFRLEPVSPSGRKGHAGKSGQKGAFRGKKRFTEAPVGVKLSCKLSNAAQERGPAVPSPCNPYLIRQEGAGAHVVQLQLRYLRGVAALKK